MSTGKKPPKTERRTSNRALELMDMFGVQRGTLAALNTYMEAYVHGSEKDARRWLREIKAVCPPSELARCFADPTAYQAAIAAEELRIGICPAKLIVMTPERRSRALTKLQSA